ncbi:MAG TPA: SIMPL domain-containing protein [Ignavibacteriaceae bacterium]|nr:SIMPL domain-containing protein [Ignavibacteriaceae bacterium]
MNNKNQLILPAAIISLVFLIGIIIIVSAWKSNYSSNQTITVTGSAKQDITSDFAILKGMLFVESPNAESAYKELEREKPILFNYLKSKGFPKDKIELSTITNFPVYQLSPTGQQTNTVIAYNYSQRIAIQSTDVYKIKAISLEISSLIEKGVNFRVDMPEYHYLKLADLKIEIQAAAAKDAMIRAEKIAEATGRKLGPMRSAKMGVLQITPRFSNQVSDYGINDLTSIDKEITAVVNASFEIE